MEKLEKDAALRIDFFGKEYVFERVNPFTVRITSDGGESMVSFSGELYVDMKKDFYDVPYLVHFKSALRLSPRSQLKFFLKIPLVTKLVLEGREKSMEIAKHVEYKRKIWHGEVHRGALCVYVEAEFEFDLFNTGDALVPLRVVNRSNSPRDISKILIEPDHLFLVRGDNGIFTNKVYIIALTPREFSAEYGTRTSARVINPFPIIDRKISMAKTVLMRFDRFGIAKELGL